MPVSINGQTGVITGLAAGGLPDGIIQTADLADDAVTIAKLSATGTASGSTFLRGDGAFAEAGGGKILKAEYGQNSTGYSTNSNYPQEAFSFTFTPTSSSSTVVIHMTIPIALNIATGIQIVGNYAVCKNDNTQLVGRKYSQQHDYMNRHSSGHAPTCQDSIVMIAKDTPNSTSHQTYKIRYGRQSGYNHRVAIMDDSGPAGDGKDISYWVIYEIDI